MIPLLPAALMALSLALAHLVLVREPLGWLSPVRRIVTKLSFKLVIATVSIGTLVVNVLLLPFLGVNNLVALVVGVIGAAIYVELALVWIGNRLQREARRPGLDWWEWAIPGAAFTALFGATLSLVGVAALLSAALWWLPIPSVASITSAMLPVGEGGP